MSKHQSYDRPPPYNEFYQPSAPPVPSSPTQPFRVFGPTNLVAVAPAVGGAEEDGQERTRSEAKPKSYAVFSVLACLFGFLCIWIAPSMALYFSLKVKSHFQMKEYTKAKRASRAALCLNIVSLCNGCVVILTALAVTAVVLLKLYHGYAVTLLLTRVSN